MDVVLSHQGVRRKNALLLRIMGSLVLPSPGAYSGWLHKLAMLGHASQTEVSSPPWSLCQSELNLRVLGFWGFELSKRVSFQPYVDYGLASHRGPESHELAVLNHASQTDVNSCPEVLPSRSLVRLLVSC